MRTLNDVILNTMHDDFFHTISLLGYFRVKNFLFSCVDVWHWFLSQRREDRDSFLTEILHLLKFQKNYSQQLLILVPLYIFKYSRTLEGNFGVSIIYLVKKMLFHSRTSTHCIKNLQSPLSSNSTFWMDFKMKCI